MTGVEQGNAHTFTVNVKDSNIAIAIVRKGDVNLDGSVASRDGTMASRAAVNTYSLNALQKIAADVNADQTINSRDSTMIKRIAVNSYLPEWD